MYIAVFAVPGPAIPSVLGSAPPFQAQKLPDWCPLGYFGPVASPSVLALPPAGHVGTLWFYGFPLSDSSVVSLVRLREVPRRC